MPKKAYLVPEGKHINNDSQSADLYRLSEPIAFPDYDDEGNLVTRHATHVWVSRLRRAFDTRRPETLAFPADAEGNVVDWGDLEGSVFGEATIEQVLENMGYEVAEEDSE